MIGLNKGYSFLWNVIGSGRDLSIVETKLIRVSYLCISCYFTLTFFLNSYTRATRPSAPVIKVGVVCSIVWLLCV